MRTQSNRLADLAAIFFAAIYASKHACLRRGARSLSKMARNDFQAHSLKGKIKGKRRIHQPFFSFKRRAQACANNSSRRRLPICG
jgi:hypothetical protein